MNISMNMNMNMTLVVLVYMCMCVASEHDKCYICIYRFGYVRVSTINS